MQELEKILEEIELEKKRVSLSPDCSNEHAVIEISLLEKIENIIRKHMNNGERFEFDFTNVKSFDCRCGQHYVNTGAENNDGWIPVEKYGLPKDDGVYDLTIIDGLEEYVSVRWQFLEGTHLSGTQHYVDGVHYWADNYQGNPINEFLSERVIAWRKKPEPYRPERSEE